MKFDKSQLRLYAVTDRAWLHGKTLESQVLLALKGGVTLLQLREKDMNEDGFKREAVRIQRVCKIFQVPFIINDNVDLARQVDADGVHVGQEDLEAGRVRALIGPDKILGVSVQTAPQARAAQAAGADYLGVGAVFPTGTKLDAAEVSRETLEEICREVDLPVVAIGGISQENMGELRGSGICGVAVVSAIFAQENPERAARELKTKLEEIL